jgi:hypothetical protein
MPISYMYTVKPLDDKREPQNIEDVERMEETDKEWVLVKTNGEKLSFGKDKFSEPVATLFTPTMITPKPQEND